MTDLNWRCDVCGRTRPDAKISVHTSDVSANHNLPKGTMQLNVKCCNDRLECIEGAPAKAKELAGGTRGADE